MKRYFIYIIMVVAALFVGCTTADIDDKTPSMEDGGQIEVSFSMNGAEIDKLDLLPVSHEVVVDVKLNVEGIYWTPVADKAWCQIVEEEHRGSGSFTIVVDSNNSFDARETAHITFKAGEYEMAKLVVNHQGNVFLFDQSYSVSLKEASSVTTIVKTIEGTVWDVENSAWISATKGASTTVDGVTSTEITVSWLENDDESRFGELHLVTPTDGDSDGVFSVWQYGTELQYDADGNILLEAQDAEALEVRAPVSTVKEVKTPSWVSVEKRANSDRTESYLLSFAGNPSDARIIRSTDVSLSMLSGSADVALPVIKQMYYDVDGIMTGEGFKTFSKTWNADGDVSQWFVDGVPTVLGDIDMTEVQGWEAIGTEARPFSLKFAGNNKAIKGLKAKQPIFGVCDGAEIENLTLEATCEFLELDDFTGSSYCLAALAGDIRSTVVSNCTNNASVQLEGSSDEVGCKIYVAGLIGKSDAESTVQLCVNNGKVAIATGVSLAAEGESYVGGIVGYNGGGLYNGFNNAEVINGASSASGWIGGIAGKSVTTIQDNSNAGVVTYKSPKATNGYVGGIVGETVGATVKNINEGNINVESPVTTLIAGGVAGRVGEEVTSLSGNGNRLSSTITVSKKPTTLYVGGHYGVLDVAYSEEGNDSSDFDGNITIVDAVVTPHIYVGGVIGYSNAAVSLKNIKHTGKILFDFKAAGVTTSKNTTSELCAAGVIGKIVDAALSIETATIDGSVMFEVNQLPAQITVASLAGAVGRVNGDVTLKDITNNATVNWDNNVAASNNGFKYCMAGIIALVESGTAVIDNCHNTAVIHNFAYNNNGYLISGGKPSATGGIVGSTGLEEVFDGTIKMFGCTSSGQLTTYRGLVGGIAGYVKNATIEECKFTANIPWKKSNWINPYYAGIAAAADNSTIKGCVVKGSMEGASAGSNVFHGAGVAGYITSTTIEDCSSFCNIAGTLLTSKAEHLGGVVGRADAQSVIKNTKFGGTVGGVEISANNYDRYIQGVSSDTNTPSEATVENCSYWDGK